MYSVEQKNLWEAYQSIYEPQELTEEVEIASQYFYEMGLNEDGVEILIEELGVEEFAEFVYDIAEDYVLTEARAGGVKIEPRLSSGKVIEGKPKAASLKALRRKKQERREREERSSEERPSGLKASLQRQSAIAAASKKQPKKKGVLDRVAGAVISGIERHNKANKNLSKAASEVGGLLRKAGKAAGGVAKEFGSGVGGTARLAGHLASKGLKEEVEEWVNSLLDEGYDLSDYTWDDMSEMYLDERAKRSKFPSQKVKNQSARHETKFLKNPSGSGSNLFRSTKMRAIASTVSAGDDPTNTIHGQDLRKLGKPEFNREEIDLFDTILEYLVSEGYADSAENAMVIMANMSEEWRDAIAEVYLPWDKPRDNRPSPRDLSARRQSQQAASGTPAGQARSQQISNVRSNMRTGINQTAARLGSDPRREGTAPFTRRHIDAAMRMGGMAGGKTYSSPAERGISPRPSGIPSTRIPASSQLRAANRAAQSRGSRGSGSSPGVGRSGGGYGPFGGTRGVVYNPGAMTDPRGFGIGYTRLAN